MKLRNTAFSKTLLILPLSLFTLVASGCSDSTDPAQRLAVSDVMDKFKQAMAIPYMPLEGESLDEAQQRYVDTLRDISVGDCPEDFQRAWNEHLAEVVQARSVSERWRDAGEAMESDDPGALVEQARDDNRVAEANLELWRVAATYDRASARFLEEMEE